MPKLLAPTWNKISIKWLLPLLLLAGGVGVYTHSTSQAPTAACPGGGFTGSTFTATFDGNPTAPAACTPAGWDVQKHSRDESTWDTPEMMEAQHGADCASPTDSGMVTHHIMTYADMVFGCRDHLMTSIKASGYGVIYLTPPALADFTTGTATISFDLSTLRTSGRDWIDVWVTPLADAMELPLDGWLPDLYGTPRNGVHIVMAIGIPTVFNAEVFVNGVTTSLSSVWWQGYESFLTPSAARRDTFRLTLSRTHISFGMPGYASYFKWVDVDIPALAWTTGVVQFGHHSYFPEKDCPAGQTCAANTWHWDNVSITPATPLTIVPLGAHHTLPGVDLNLPAGTGRTLRYGGEGTSLQLSYDGGATWLAGGLVAGSTQATTDQAHIGSYAAAVPNGATRVRMRATPVYGSFPIVGMFDPHVWMATVTLPTPSATATPTPTQAPTTTVTPAPSPTPTATVAATATPTAPPLPCRMAVYLPSGTLTPGGVVACP